jgi:hypothetical protein
MINIQLVINYKICLWRIFESIFKSLAAISTYMVSSCHKFSREDVFVYTN